MGGYGIEAATLPSPALGIDKDVLRDVVRAIRHQHGLAVTYLAMNATRSRDRTIWPHALFSTGLRWYVRVYDGASKSFRSLVLARIETSKHVKEACSVAVINDEDWQKRITVHVVPHPKLNPHQQTVVAREFGMKRSGKTWLWSVELRQCLVGHFLRRYRLDTKGLAYAESHWVVLRNPGELKPYLLPEGKE
jgi:predicted DNA-binding transcriptional regulator YafY